MNFVPQVLGFIHSGVSSNWWGLWCPAHCSGSTALLAFSFASGTIFGILLALYFFRASLFLPSPAAAFPRPETSRAEAPSQASTPLRLRKYLHGPESI